MKRPLKLTLPEPPSANRYWRHAKGRTYLSPEAKQYRQDVSAICLPKRLRALDGQIAVSFIWYRSRKDGDLDNRVKQLLDSLRGHAYTDDDQIIELHAYRVDRPRDGAVEVEVWAAETGEPK